MPFGGFQKEEGVEMIFAVPHDFLICVSPAFQGEAMEFRRVFSKKPVTRILCI